MKIIIAMLTLAALAGCKPSLEQEVKTNARIDIKACWVEQARKSNTPYDARSMARVCERYEAEYLKAYGEKA